MTGSVIEIAAAVAAGTRRAVDVARAALERAADYDRLQPQAWIHRLSAAEVLERAGAVDARIAAGEHLALAGVPFAVKDNIDVAGVPTTAGCPAFSYLPRETARVVARLEAAGAVLLGKTNLDQFATGLVGTRSPYGAPACVFNRQYVSGGSSSGSAVVVAAGVAAFALGTDTAGSGRVPAAFNGLVGWKPSRGRWSTRGVVPACRSLDCVTVFAQTVADAARVDAVCAAYDAQDPYSRVFPVPGTAAVAAAADGRQPALRLGFPRADQLQFFGDAESAALHAAACARLAALPGVAVVADVDIASLLDAAALLYGGPWVAERLIAVEPLLARAPQAIHPVVRAIIEGARGMSAVETFRAMYALEGHRRAAEALWRRIDLLVLPTAPTIYRISEVLAEPVTLNSQLGRYTNFVNLLDLGAIALPGGFRGNGTGYGVSLIGPAGSDPVLLELAAQAEAEATATAAPSPPLDRAPRPPSVQLAVVGAHLDGMPLHYQLTARGARLVRRTRTAATYRLYAMTASSPPKPALVHAGPGGAALEVEVYELGLAEFGSFVAEVPAPLAIGTVTLEDGSDVKGFVAEPRALDGALEITRFGGWRAWLASR